MKTASTLPQDIPKLVAETCLCQAIQSAGRTVGRKFDAGLKDIGLTGWQFSLLMALDRDEPPTVGALAVDLACDRTTVTANLKPLQRRGMVEVAHDRNDGRTRRITLTASGRAILAEAVERWRLANAAIIGSLGTIDPNMVRAALHAIARS